MHALHREMGKYVEGKNIHLYLCDLTSRCRVIKDSNNSTIYGNTSVFITMSNQCVCVSYSYVCRVSPSNRCQLSSANHKLCSKVQSKSLRLKLLIRSSTLKQQKKKKKELLPQSLLFLYRLNNLNLKKVAFSCFFIHKASTTAGSNTCCICQILMPDVWPS